MLLALVFMISLFVSPDKRLGNFTSLLKEATLGSVDVLDHFFLSRPLISALISIVSSLLLAGASSSSPDPNGLRCTDLKLFFLC